MDFWNVIMEVVLLLACAFLFGSLAQRFRQSPILGYILAGVVVGPVMSSGAMVNQMAELGVSLLLFSIGLEFSFQQLRRMGRLAFGGGSLQVMCTMGLVALGLALFFSLPKAMAIGALVALSSTTIVLRVLVDKAEMESVHGRASLGILLFQDMAIVPLVLMIGLLSPSGGEAGVLMNMLQLFAAVAGLVLVLYLLLYHLIPRLLSSAVLFANRELTVLFAVSTGLGATWASHAVGISPALGAFVAGMLLGESPFATQVRADIGSLRTLMVTLFFASVGMFIKPLWFVTHLHYIVPTALIIFVLKAGVLFCVTRMFGLDRRHALATGITLGQVGEFSFVLTQAARDGGLIGLTAVDLIISVTIVLMLATPYMVAWALPLSDRLLAVLPGQDSVSATNGDNDGKTEARRVIVVGLGPAGRHVVRTLKTRGFVPVIIDVNPLSRQFAVQEAVEIHLGDVTREEVLHHAGLHKACMVVITVPDPKISIQAIETIRHLDPHMPQVVRCRYNRHRDDLAEAGATVVVDEEVTMGEMLSHRITECLADDECTLLACRMTAKGIKDPSEISSKDPEPI
ncbi:MAG TPA: sodium:proton exchanger [Desulfobacteraceae bacterium]|nr:sodium:proton exchanger [Desulfobacteraceae bacterium]|tara:strand:- start:312 stop:2024 length:1713 start_codon:yes stop_codon:yes gene_type:complete